MPVFQLLINLFPLTAGYLVKYLFFIKIGFGKDYKEGILEGLRTARAQKKVRFQLRHLPNYIRIEAELIINTFSYVKDWFRRKLLKK